MASRLVEFWIETIPGITIGDTYNVYHKSPESNPWSLLTTCTIDVKNRCVFFTSDFSSFAITQTTESTTPTVTTTTTGGVSSQQLLVTPTPTPEPPVVPPIEEEEPPVMPLTEDSIEEEPVDEEIEEDVEEEFEDFPFDNNEDTSSLTTDNQGSDGSSSGFTDFIEEVVASVTDFVQSTAGQVMTTLGILASVAGVATAGMALLPQLSTVPMRLWNFLLSGLGLKKKVEKWGVVYDAVTKQPLDPAYVMLMDVNGKEVATSITDLDGRYGFLVKPGTYTLIIHKTDYQFPSQKLANTTKDAVYDNLYFGGQIIITEEGQVIKHNIPMDPLQFNWNEFAKKEMGVMSFDVKHEAILVKIASLFFWIGFGIATWALFVLPSTLNSIVFIAYVVIFFVRVMLLKPHPHGTVTHRGVPLSFGIIRVFSAKLQKEIKHVIIDERGRYYCLIANGNYYITIEAKNADESYSPVFTSEPFSVTKGIIDTAFETESK